MDPIVVVRIHNHEENSRRMKNEQKSNSYFL